MYFLSTFLWRPHIKYGFDWPSAIREKILENGCHIHALALGCQKIMGQSNQSLFRIILEIAPKLLFSKKNEIIQVWNIVSSEARTWQQAKKENLRTSVIQAVRS